MNYFDTLGLLVTFYFVSCYGQILGRPNHRPHHRPHYGPNSKTTRKPYVDPWVTYPDTFYTDTFMEPGPDPVGTIEPYVPAFSPHPFYNKATNPRTLQDNNDSQERRRGRGKGGRRGGGSDGGADAGGGAGGGGGGGGAGGGGAGGGGAGGGGAGGGGGGGGGGVPGVDIPSWGGGGNPNIPGRNPGIPVGPGGPGFNPAVPPLFPPVFPPPANPPPANPPPANPPPANPPLDTPPQPRNPLRPINPPVLGPDVAIQNRVPDHFAQQGPSQNSAARGSSPGRTTGIVAAAFIVLGVIGAAAFVLRRKRLHQSEPYFRQPRDIPQVQLSYAPQFV